MAGLENKLANVHVGDLIRLESSSLHAAGYVVDFNEDTVELSHEDPNNRDPGKLWDSHRKGMGRGDRIYNLKYFTDSEIVQKQNITHQPVRYQKGGLKNKLEAPRGTLIKLKGDGFHAAGYVVSFTPDLVRLSHEDPTTQVAGDISIDHRKGTPDDRTYKLQRFADYNVLRSITSNEPTNPF